MTACAKCDRSLPDSNREPTLRAEGKVYHLSCAPEALVNAATEEYRAILRKGVRYFVEKHGEGPVEAGELGRRFLELGRALETEAGRRGRN